MKNKICFSLAAAALSFVLLAPAASAQAPTRSPKPTLAPGRMRACEARSSTVQTRLSQLIRMVSNMLEVFDSHATKVQKFYTDVVLPSGETVANYETLVAQIASKKQAVVDTWTKAKTNADAFTCTGGDPKQLLTQFRLDMQATKQALKDYRTAIKNLIVAIHRVAPTPAPSPSPSPSPSPEAL